MTKGGRNLLIMGIAAGAISIATAGTAVIIYHNSGDIYLDRSRPGYLPDEAEIEEEPMPEDYKFNRSGTVDASILKEYLDHLKIEIQTLEAYDDAFSESALSDEKLGIHE